MRVIFSAKISLDRFDFSSNFYAFDFGVSRDLKFSLNQLQAAELNWRQFNTKNKLKSAPKLGPFFILNFNSGIC